MLDDQPLCFMQQCSLNQLHSIYDHFLNLQPWQTPTNKLWPASARADEIHGDRNVVATLYEKLVPRKKPQK